MYEAGAVLFHASHERKWLCYDVGKSMSKKVRIAIPLLLLAGVVAVLIVFLRSHDVAILSPAGTVAEKQRNLLVFATLLGMIVIIPVFAMTILFAWKYRAGNKNSVYKPEWSSNHALELVWWGIPILIIIVLSIVTWRSSHELDPYRPLASDKQPVTIQVVALQWKWLFIYPQQNIATVNFVQFPEDTPVNFEITSDAPMNSFWIPKLGGQVYAMNGMVTKLHLQAHEPGEYDGVSANISGEGFAGMKFVAKSSTQADFDHWVQSVQQSENRLTLEEYEEVAKPSKNNPAAFYSSKVANLHDTIVMKYMDHANESKDALQNYNEDSAQEAHSH